MQSAFLDFVDIFAGLTMLNAISDASSMEYFCYHAKKVEKFQIIEL